MTRSYLLSKGEAMKLLKPFDQIAVLRQYNRENPQNQISEKGVCDRLAFKWAAMQLVQSPF